MHGRGFSAQASSRARPEESHPFPEAFGAAKKFGTLKKVGLNLNNYIFSIY
jgi:hypothetical protein